jgi:hypothetical protein
MKNRPTCKLSTLVAAALLVGTPAAFASEALDIELPSMRTPIVESTAVPMASPQAQVYAFAGEAASPELESRQEATRYVASRDDVKLELAEAQAAGTLPIAGELADAPAVLQARVNANAEQTLALQALADLDYQRQVELAQSSEVTGVGTPLALLIDRE